MRSFLVTGAAAIALCVALPAAAQSLAAAPSKSRPPATSPTATVPASTAVNPPVTTDPAVSPATSPSMAAPGATPSAPPLGAAIDASANAPITSGLPVKDKTGVVIGQITQVKPDAVGKLSATIKMGADSFAVDASALVVQDGAAVINSSQAELQGMIKKTTPPAPATPEATTPKKKK